ncbi:galactinol synthase 2 [Capsicum galapagoense]
MMTPNDFGLTKKVVATGLARVARLPSRAYVTFLVGKGDYVKGVVGLAKGLRKVKSSYPLVVAVLLDVLVEHRHILISQGCIVREIKPVYPPENHTQFSMTYYVISYSKLRILEFVEYNKMIYLDGDIQVFENIDHLFNMPDGYFYAVMDCFCENTWSHSPQYNIGYCQQCPNKVQWPEEKLGQKPSRYFNASMFVLKPSLSTYNDLLRILQVTPPTSFAEQIQVLSPSSVSDPKYLHLHFHIGSKPWRYTGEEENMDTEEIKMLVKNWRDIYNDDSLDYISNAIANSKFMQALIWAYGSVRYILGPPAM